MLSTTTKDYQVTRGRLASLFMPSTTQDFNNYSSSESQRRKPKRRTLMPRFICYARENLFNSTVSADSNEAIPLLWNGGRRRRSSSRGSYGLIHESHKLDHQTQSEKENVPACKLVPPQIMSRRRVLSLRSRKSLHATALRQHVIEEKRLMEPSLVNNIAKAHSSEEISKCKFLLPKLRGVVNAMVKKKNAGGEKAPQYSSMMTDPSDVSKYTQRGPVFGAALEDQISSHEFPNVPLVLHATIAALESRGLHIMGLYRVPGRQSEIDRFVCASNRSVLNPHSMISLPTWNDIRALTGLIQLFLRSLPEPICDPTSWTELAVRLPQETERMSKHSLFATLRSIRSKLIKERTTSTKKWQCTFATLDFLFSHLRRIVALKEVNYCSLKLIATYFEPCLFNVESRSGAKFNVLLELMLQHWPWLKAELIKEFPSSSQLIGAYIDDFLENGPDFSEDLKAYASVKYARSGEEVLDIVKGILESVGQNEVGQ